MQMKVVIDIPEDEYNYIKNCYPDGEDGERYAYMIKKNGTPLEEVLGDIKGDLQRKMNKSNSEDFNTGIRFAFDVFDSHISGKEQG